jgi:hypothetical protein
VNALEGDERIIKFPEDSAVQRKLTNVRAQLRSIRQTPRWYQDGEARALVDELKLIERALVQQLVQLAVPPPPPAPWFRGPESS